MTDARAWLLPALLIVALSAAATVRAEVFLQSGPERVALLEVYTSQGCSSCPPADLWLSRLKEDPGLWKRLVPVAFHVDYWDYIGWRDPFGQPAFAQRQRKYAREGGLPTVYTPGMLLNGEEWRRWTRVAFPQPPRPHVGILVVEREGQRLHLSFAPAMPATEPLRGTVALLGFDLKSDVTAGENRGLTLNNDFIVLGLQQALLRRKGGSYSAILPDFAADPADSRLAIAAWVSEDPKQAPVQAVGGWFNP